MNQIQNQNPLLSSSSLNGLSAAATAAASGSAARKDGVPAFSQWLNQSSQQLQTRQLQSQQQNQQLQNQQQQAQQLQSQQQAQQLQNQQAQNAQNARDNAPKAPEPEHSAAQDENKLAARNAASRSSANKADGAKASGQSRAEDTGQTEAADAKDAAEAEGAERAQAVDGEGSDKKVAKDSKDAKDGKDASATPGEQILAMLRSEAPAQAKGRARGDKGDSAEGDAADAALSGGTRAHGKHPPTTGDVLRERQQLQRELAQAASGKGQDAGAKDDAMQAVNGQGAYEIALGDGKTAASGTPQSFDAMLAAAQQTGGATGTNASSATGRAEPPSVPLSQPLHSPDFAPELSASVSLLLKDGIHEAQLQLNPTEMGPVSINIQLDGQQAQVNFHAQHAATREVLERSLPDLAAALQAQGLTLSGGGVFAQQQSSGSQNQRDGSADGSSGGNGRRGAQGHEDDGGIAATGRAERRTPARGLVDLYA